MIERLKENHSLLKKSLQALTEHYNAEAGAMETFTSLVKVLSMSSDSHPNIVPYDAGLRVAKIKLLKSLNKIITSVERTLNGDVVIAEGMIDEVDNARLGFDAASDSYRECCEDRRSSDEKRSRKKQEMMAASKKYADTR